MRKLLTLCLTAFIVLSANAQILNIHTANGTKQYPVSAVDSITISAEGTEAPLVTAKVTNISAFSFDADVKKSASCQKYVASVYRKDLFSEKEFAETAEQTLDPTSWYKPLKNIYYEDAFIPERDLNVHSLNTEDGKDFVLAIAAMDDLGGMKIYTEDFTIPAPVINGTATATILVDSATLRFDYFEYKVRCNYTTAKVVLGCTNIEWMQGFSKANFDAKSEADKQAYIMKQYQNLPEEYSTQCKGAMQTSPEQTFLVYAIPIGNDGKIGKMDYTFVTTPAPLMNGTATIECTKLSQGADYAKVDVSLKASANTDAVRLMWLCRTDFGYYSASLDEAFTKEEGLGIIWQEYPANQLPTQLDVYHPGDDYALWAVAVDGRGRLSKPVDLCLAATGNKYFLTKEKEKEPDPEVTLGGKGKIGLEIEEVEVEARATYHLNYTITKGENTARAFVIRTGESLEGDVKKVVDEHLAGYPNDYFVRHEIDFSEGNTFSGTEQSLIAYNTKFGGSFVIFVTLDTDGKFAITHYYAPLVGLKEYK